MSGSDYPDFESPAFLHAHIKSTLDFYDPIVFDPKGGFFGVFSDAGDCFDPGARQLVGSARYVFNYATAYRLYGDPKHKVWANHGLRFLNGSHRQVSGGYAWQLNDGIVTDSRIMAYGHAFVLLAAAACMGAGIHDSAKTIRAVFDFCETYFWDEAAGAYNDERDASLTVLSPYRGQNANMHMCEALLAAFEATGEEGYLNRAERLATKFAFDRASQTGGQIWEHYDADWQADMLYNKESPNDRYRPWGFQPGHQTEWSKLLLILNVHRPNEKWPAKARALYDGALQTGWDAEYGGIAYGVSPDGGFCAAEKYFWVQAESFAAAWRLFRATGEDAYRKDYHRIWQWAWDNLVDHKHGAWFRVRAQDGLAIDNKKSPLGKTDYHTMGACWDVLAVG